MNKVTSLKQVASYALFSILFFDSNCEADQNPKRLHKARAAVGTIVGLSYWGFVQIKYLTTEKK